MKINTPQAVLTVALGPRDQEMAGECQVQTAAIV